MGKDAVNSIQFLPGGSFRASVSSRECKVMLEYREPIVIGSHECTIRATGPPQVDLYVHYYPFEAPDADIRGALSKVWHIKSLSYQSFPGYPDVKTGSRIIKMIVEKEIPSQLSIQRFPVASGIGGSPCDATSAVKLVTWQPVAQTKVCAGDANSLDTLLGSALRHGTPPKLLFRRSPVLLRLALPPLRRPNLSRSAPLANSLPRQTRSMRLKKRSVS